MAGLAWDWSVAIPAFPAPSWAFHFYLRGPGSLDLVALPDGAAHRFSATAAQTASLQKGIYAWQLIGADGEQELLVDEGRVTVSIALSRLADGHEARTHAERMIGAIEAVLENRATLEQRRYRINNRELERTSITELRRLLKEYRVEAAQQAAKRAGRSIIGRNHVVRF
jgi:hypothetical protein